MMCRLIFEEDGGLEEAVRYVGELVRKHTDPTGPYNVEVKQRYDHRGMCTRDVIITVTAYMNFEDQTEAPRLRKEDR